MQPVSPNDPDNGLMLVDEVDYDDESPWPGTSDGAGDSLQRTRLAAHGNFAASWRALDPTPGAAEFILWGDLDLNGELERADADLMAVALNDPSAYLAMHGALPATAGDGDDDGDLDFDDIDDVVALVEAVFAEGGARESRE
jgi:hypothetical protein